MKKKIQYLTPLLNYLSAVQTLFFFANRTTFPGSLELKFFGNLKKIFNYFFHALEVFIVSIHDVRHTGKC